jgi:hypothetical protein
MSFQKIRDWTDLVLKILSIAAIIAGGIWAYYQFSVARTDIDNIQLTVSTEQKQYGKETRLLLIHIKPKNIGKSLVELGKTGFIVTIRSIPDNHKQGIIDLEKLPKTYEIDLMERFKDGYEMEPGVEYDEVAALVVPKNAIYSIKATLDQGEDDEVDHTVVTRIE